MDPQPRNVLLVPARLVAQLDVRELARRPERQPPERPLEVADRSHRDRVDHLLMELWIALRRRQTVLREDVRIVQVDRRVEAAAGRIAVNDLEILADRPGLQRVPAARVALPGHLQRDLVNSRGLQLDAEARVEGKDPEASLGRSERQTGPRATEQRLPAAPASAPLGRPLLDLIANGAGFRVDEEGAPDGPALTPFATSRRLHDLDHPLQR